MGGQAVADTTGTPFSCSSNVAAQERFAARRRIAVFRSKYFRAFLDTGSSESLLPLSLETVEGEDEKTRGYGGEGGARAVVESGKAGTGTRTGSS
jgi:hypothetical protein